MIPGEQIKKLILKHTAVEYDKLSNIVDLTLDNVYEINAWRNPTNLALPNCKILTLSDYSYLTSRLLKAFVNLLPSKLDSNLDLRGIQVSFLDPIPHPEKLKKLQEKDLDHKHFKLSSECPYRWQCECGLNSKDPINIWWTVPLNAQFFNRFSHLKVLHIVFPTDIDYKALEECKLESVILE